MTVTLASGQKVEGRLGRIDDFVVTLTEADGTPRTFTRNGDLPKVEIHDPLLPHKRSAAGIYGQRHSRRNRVHGDTEMRATACCGRSLCLLRLPPPRRCWIRRCCMKPLGDSWPTYSGDYSGKRYSSLTQLNQSNVKNLTLAWVSRITAGPGGRGARGDHRRRRHRRSGCRRRHQRQRRRAGSQRRPVCLRLRIMPGLWMPATGMSCGITSGKRAAARTSATAAWACTATGCSWRRRTIIWSRWMPRPARSAGIK